MKTKNFIMIFITNVCLLVFSLAAHSQAREESTGPMLSLENAVMCESIEAYLPKNTGIVFSISIGKVVCYTAFDSVPTETIIYHDWYRKDQLSTRRKLVLKPPEWSTVTEIQLREADKGPWRVEVVDENGSAIRTLRFSITD